MLARARAQRLPLLAGPWLRNRRGRSRADARTRRSL